MHRVGAVVGLLLALGSGCSNGLSSRSQPISQWEGGEVTVPLLANEGQQVGTVKAWFEGGRLNVQYAADAPWSLAETQLDVRDAWTEIPQTKTHNPIPGHFTYHQQHAPGVQQYVYLVDLSSLHGPRLYFAAHAELSGAGASDGAWGAGTRFTERGNWATWFALDAQVESVLAEGTDWQLVDDRHVLPDGTPLQQDLFLLQNASGINGAPLPPDIQADLALGAGAEDSYFVVNASIVQEIITSERIGQLTPALAAIAEPQALAAGKLSSKCPDVPVTNSLNIDITDPYDQSTSLGGGVTGTLTASGDIAVHASAELTMLKRRFKLLWWCIPYGAQFRSFRAHGSADVGQGATLTGEVSRTWSWEREVKTIQLRPIDFWVGPIWVHIPLKLPIVAGLDVETSLAGSVSYVSTERATGSFDYLCTPSCTGTASYHLPNQGLQDVLGAGVSGRIKPNLWIDVALNASLYWEKFLNAQVGVRPKLEGDLWGYYGNTCGDADGDGTWETVSALTADLDFQVFITAAYSAFGGSPHKNDDLFHFSRIHLGFWDLLGSTALRPMLEGPSIAQVNTATTYQALMRPCWPYGDAVDYQLSWGDGTTYLSGPPTSGTSATHTWANQGPEPLVLTALRDHHGRTLGSATSRTVDVQAPQVVPVPTSGLQLWLRADVGVEETGGFVSRWLDQSGNGNDAIMANSSRQPLLVPGALGGQPALEFDGAQSLYLSQWLQLPQATVFVVARNNRLDDQFSMILGPGGNSPNNQLRFENGSDVLLVTPDIFTAPVGNTRVFMALAVGYDGATWSVFRDGALKSTHVSTSGPWELAQVGAYYSEEFMVGNIAEVMAYDRPLTDAERGAVNDYLRGKYGLP